MRTRALTLAGLTILGGLGLTRAPTRLNPVIDLLEQKRPIFGLYAPANPRARGGAAAADAPVKTPAQLAQDALAYAGADYIFDGSMERDFDRGYAAFVEFSQGMFDGGLLRKAPAPRLRQPLFVKTPEIAADPTKARERISQQLNLGVSGIVFVDVRSADEVKQGLAMMRFASKGGTRPDVVGSAPALWGMSEKEYRQRADLWPLDPAGELVNFTIVESKEGLENVREIAAVRGIGVLFPGAGTLRGVFSTTDSTGRRVLDAAAWEAAIQRVLAACKEFSVPCGYPAGEADIEMRMKQGFSVFIIGWGDQGFRAVDIGRRVAGRPVAPLPAQDADLVVRNARIWTGDSTRPFAEALAVRGERLVLVGSNADADAHRSARTRVIDAGGRFVTPGFIDDHTHFAQAGALLIGANLLDVSSAAPLAGRVKAAVARMSSGAWLTGGDWGAYEDRASRFAPDRSIIDSVSGSTPVLLNRWDRSAWLANGVALERAGLTCARPLSGLECSNGRATGRVSDSALARLRRAIAPKTFDQRLREAKAAQQHLSELGVTTIHDNTTPAQLPVYTELKRRGELTVRVFARPTLDKWNELTYAGISPGFGDDWIRIRALKGFVDGIQGNSTARFYEPQLHSGKKGEWRDSTNTAATNGAGSGMEPAGNMERLLFGLDSAGWWANVHAIGDHAIDSVLTIMEKVIATNGPRERRWRIIHSQVIRNAAVAQRYKRLGIIAEVQPYHAIDDMRWMEERIGARAKWAYAFRTFRDAGVPLLFGSDWPGTNASWYTANPMVILYAAVTRQTLDGKPEGGWFPEQRLDLETGLRSYTVNNAWAEGEEANKGSLAPGKLADFVVIDRDLFAIPPTQLKDAKVLLTVVGGRIVHASAPFVR